MDVQREAGVEELANKSSECHCSVCFKEINDIEAATHKLAGRYYCRSCRSVFGEKSLNDFTHRAV